MTNKAVAAVLKETAALIEVTGGNMFRSRAMTAAARTIERLEDPVEKLLSEGTLTDIRGIGTGLAAQISELLETGSFSVRDNLMGSIPPGLMDVLAVKGLGPKKVRALWKQLGIQSLDDLQAAAETRRIETLEGFGAKSQTSILDGVAALRSYRARRHYADAFHLTQSIESALRALPGIDNLSVCGEVRRNLETVGRIDFVAVTTDEGLSALGAAGFQAEPSDFPPDLQYRGSTEDGLPIVIRCSDASRFGRVLFESTGSQLFLSAWHERFGHLDDLPDETDIFERAGVEFIPPELREDERPIEAARNRKLPHLIEENHLQGSLHNHSTYSDGAHTLRQMADAARSLGLSYFGICDHSQSLRIAHGLDADEVRRQHEEIDHLNSVYQSDGGPEFRIFKGIESDILSDGSLDYPDAILAGFDFVVASVHTGFNMTEEEATDRVVRAVSNPYTRILGHPTGRLLLRREGYPLNHEAVLDACAQFGVSIEMNANPYRLDLDWRWVRAAAEQGILISINPDAHSIEQLDYTRWGIMAARKGWLESRSCLNAMSLQDFSEWIALRKTKSQPA